MGLLIFAARFLNLWSLRGNVGWGHEEYEYDTILRSPIGETGFNGEVIVQRPRSPGGTVFNYGSKRPPLSGCHGTLASLTPALGAKLPFFPSWECCAKFVVDLDAKRGHKLFHLAVTLRTPDRLTSA